MLTDAIADMLTRIRNGYLAKKAEVSAPYSKIKEKTVDILVENQLLEKVEVKGKDKDKHIKMSLKYVDGKPAITKIIRVSRPGKRVYQKSKDLPLVLSGLGIAIVSTPKGIMTVKEAKKENLGGEVICQVW